MTIKDRMKSGYQTITGALDSCNISIPRRKLILNEYKAVCYQWAEANACACLMEGYFKDAAPEAYEGAVRCGVREIFGLAAEMSPPPDKWDEDDEAEGE